VRRVDPEDGKERSLEEAEARYKGKFKPAEISQYWRKNCRAVASRPGASGGPPPGVQLPRMELLRICLLSGGVYKHPAASKVEVASALIKGLISGSGGPLMPVLDFAFDDDCFLQAWKELGLPLPEGS